MSFQLKQLIEIRKNIHKQINDYLWQETIASKPLWARFLLRSTQILFAILRDLMQGQLSLRAMSLVFTTIIGFLPLLALTFSVLKGLGVHNALEPTLLALLEPLGDRAQEFTSQALQFVDELQVELIGITATGLLFYTVLDMMRKIEISFNFIWAVEQGRSWSSILSEYLFAVIVSPLLLFLSISLSSYVNTTYFESALENIRYGSMVISAFAFTMPVVLMSFAFAFAYSFLPNTRVNFSSALVGGLVTTIIWKLMGSVFQAFFVSSARESIYLAFASPIAVMFFAYFGWLVALIGSSISFYHQNPAKTRSGRGEVRLSFRQQELLCLTVAATIIRRFHKGEESLDLDEIAHELDVSIAVLEPAISRLIAIGLLKKTNEDPVNYLPGKSVHDCTIIDIWQAIRSKDADHLLEISSAHELESMRTFQQEIDAIIARELGTRKFIDERQVAH